MNRIATKILMALAAVAVPALAVAGFLGWMLITTVQEVGSDVEEALSTQRRVAQIRVLMEKESGLVFRLPSELDQARITEYAGRLGELAKMLDGEIEAFATNRRLVQGSAAGSSGMGPGAVQTRMVSAMGAKSARKWTELLLTRMA